MYCVRILYPNKPGSNFNWKHYYDVHLPLGLGLLNKHVGIKPLKVEVDQNMSHGGKPVHGPHHCICSLFFPDRRSAEAMVALFDIEEPRRLLTSDWPNYTEVDPEIEICEVVGADVVTGRLLAA